MQSFGSMKFELLTVLFNKVHKINQYSVTPMLKSSHQPHSIKEFKTSILKQKMFMEMILLVNTKEE
jgi:hypothetical protein